MGQVVTSRKAIYADLEAVHPHLVAEILDGELITHPRPRQRHSRGASRILATLGSPFDIGTTGPGGWKFYSEPEFHFDDHVVVPDVAGFYADRTVEPVDGVYITSVPDWVCEILSPTTEVYDRGSKWRIYHEVKVGHYWLFDPRIRTLEVYEWRKADWLQLGLYTGADIVTARPFDAVAIPLEHFLPGE
jgi:Uma2 family endonuclease